MTDFYDIAFLVLMAIVFPLQGIWEIRCLAGWVRDGRTDARMRAYGWVIGFLWIVTALVVVSWSAAGRGAIAPGAVFSGDAWGWGGMIGAVLMAGALVVQFLVTRRSPEHLEQAREQMGELSMIAPRNPREFRTWNVVSVSAGICEEILYRGVLMVVLTAWTGPWIALALSSLVFGLGHAYQGPTGVIRTGAVGLALGLLVLLTGSLLPAMLVHTVLDITSGRLLGAAVAGPPAQTAPA
jgi:membrane protease YdiL (CAAX protease family)